MVVPRWCGHPGGTQQTCARRRCARAGETRPRSRDAASASGCSARWSRISSEKGYEATKIADLVKMAGVSRAAFYEHFEDKKECLLAAVDALVEPTIALIERAEDAPTGEARVRQAVEAFLGLVAAPAGRLEDGLHRGLRGRARGRSGGRAGARHLRALRGQPAEPDPGPRRDAAADGAGDARRLPEGDPEAPLQRRSRPAAAAGRGHRRLGPLLPAAARPARGAAPAGPQSRSRSPSARRSPTRPSGCCGRWRRSSPRRATRRPRSPRWSSGPAPRSGVFYGHFENKEEALPRRPRQRLGADAGRGPARLPPRPQLAGVGARRLRGDVRVRDRRARVHASSARSRCTRSASGRCRPATG